jgi:hypothetical protein
MQHCSNRMYKYLISIYPNLWNPVYYRHLQTKQLQSTPHKDCVKLGKKVQDSLAFYQQSCRSHCTLPENCHPLKIDLLKLTQSKLLARIHPKAKLLDQPGRPKRPP